MAKTKAKHPGGRPPLPAGRRLGVMVGVRLDADSAARLDAIAERLGGVLHRSQVARAALRLGIDLLDRDPTLLVKGGATVRGSRK